MHTGGSPPSPDTLAQRGGEGGGRGEAPGVGHVSVPQAREQQLLTRVWSSYSTGAGDPREGREGKESGAKVGDPCLRGSCRHPPPLAQWAHVIKMELSETVCLCARVCVHDRERERGIWQLLSTSSSPSGSLLWPPAISVMDLLLCLATPSASPLLPGVPISQPQINHLHLSPHLRLRLGAGN